MTKQPALTPELRDLADQIVAIQKRFGVKMGFAGAHEAVTACAQVLCPHVKLYRADAVREILAKHGFRKSACIKQLADVRRAELRRMKRKGGAA